MGMLGLLLACGGGAGVVPGICAGCAGGTGGEDVGGGVPGEDGFLYGDETLELGITLSDDAIARLPTDPDEDAEDVPAVLTWAGERWDVGLQLKGGQGSFRRFDQKPSFRLDFGEGDGGLSFSGTRYLVLNNLVQDDSMLAEHAAYAVYRALGVAAPRHGYARVTVNGEWFGLYGIVEDVRADFVDRNWPEDRWGVLLKGGVDLLPGQEDGFEVVEGGGVEPLYEMVAALDAAQGDAFLPALEEWFDTDHLFDQWAAELATGNPDAYVTRHNNFFLYWQPAAQTWAMIPWGTDTAFTDPLPRWREDYEGQLYLKCLASPSCMDALGARLEGVLAWWEGGELEAHLRDVAERTEQDCLTDPRSEAGPEGCAAAREALFDFVAGRPTQLREVF